MALFRFNWLYKLIRKNTNPIPEVNAAKWKQRLSIGYAFVAWNAFGIVCYCIYNGKADWAAYHGVKSEAELAMSPGQQWVKTLGIQNAEVYRVSGLNITKIDSIQDGKITTEKKEIRTNENE